MNKLGVALLGLDHWYAALNIAPAVANGAQTRLVAVSHDDEAKARQVANENGAEVATTDYRAALDRADVDIVVALYSTERNVAVCRDAAAAGKHIVAVKPMAMDLAGADAIVTAVRAAGVYYLPFECSHRLAPAARRIKGWLDEGRIGRPVRYLQSFHSGLPQAWPGSQESGWWIDPKRVPGGAWIDHAIYAVDLVRWLLGSELTLAHGLIANQRYPNLPVEDYGIATYTLANQAVAVIEDTWTAERGFFFGRNELIGSTGALIDDTRSTGRLLVRGDFGWDDWTALEQQRPGQSAIVDHLVACIREESAPIATVEDGRANLAACLAFYQAAHG